MPRKSGKLPCGYGFSCSKRMKGCGYAHPQPTCKWGDSCKKGLLGGCPFGHGKACKNGVHCTISGCAFTHSNTF